MITWGGAWVNVKFLSYYINEYEMIYFRYLITAITMVPIIMGLKLSFKIDVKSFALVCVASLVLIAYMRYFFLGTQLGTASLGGALVMSMTPINTFVFLVLLGSRKMTRKDTFALSLGAIGVLTMLNIWQLALDKIMVMYNLYFILASILWPILTIVSSKSTKISPIVFTFYMYIVTVALVNIFFVDVRTLPFERFDITFWINVGSISLLSSTFANTVYFLGIEKLGAAEVSSFVFLVPFSAIILSALFLKEQISLSIVIGTILTLLAVKMLNNIRFMPRTEKKR